MDRKIDFEKIEKFVNGIGIPLTIILLVIVASVPAFRSAVYDADDLSFHLGRIQALAEGLQMGQFPVRYEQNAWNGYGYVSSLYYGNIFLYIPAIMYLLGLPVYRAYNIYLILINILTVCISYYSFRRLLNDSYWGMGATIIYCLAGYRLTNLYVRAAVGEYTAMAFLPLLVYGVYKIYNSNDGEKAIKKITPFVVSVSCIIQSHILTTEMVFFLIMVFILFNLRRISEVIKLFLLSVFLILGLNMFFLVPFIDSFISMNLNVNVSTTSNSVQGSGLYICQLLGLFTKPNGQNTLWGTENEGFLNVGLLMIVCLIITLINVCYEIVSKSKLEKNIESKLLNQYIIMGIIAIWMSSVYFPWDAIKSSNAIGEMIASVQYPWRYIAIVNLVFSLSAMSALKKLIGKNIKKYFLVFAFCIVAVVTTGVFDYQLSFKTNRFDIDAPSDWADRLYLPIELDARQLLNTEAKDIEDKMLLPVIAYENVSVIDTHGHKLKTTSKNGLLMIDKTDFMMGYSIKYIEPFLWRICEAISFIFLVVYVTFLAKNKNDNPSRMKKEYKEAII